MEATPSQISFWEKLIQEKEFPPSAPDADTLKSQFSRLNKKSASEWIDKALKLPDKGAGDETLVTAPF